MTECFYLQWDIDENSGGLLIKEFLHNAGISRTALTDIKFKGGKILVNGKEENVRYRLIAGDVLKVIFPPENPSFEGEDIPLNIIYEDEFLLVVVKPAGMNTIPSREHPNGSLANALVGYYNKMGLQATAHIVTRLDRETSGIVLIAKHRHVHHLFSMMQRKREINRTYEALAAGWIVNDKGSIRASIGRKEDSIIEREVREDGQYACTHYQVINRFREYTHIELKLETGRTHQIRVHMSYIGHPLLGDDLYGGDTSFIKRQALHCKKIQFTHPFTREKLIFTAPLPEDMLKLIVADPQT
ncbi:RluA family pseudouridine synthase [Neobacillus sedimentimangrovi]|jgi:23S rRNA pseudouridine1911/1915/1917 synthase|uniref:Pseudouridine synthase n=1 Tax=Neobacillus sedimentimangrovi TaxID=2699460 RepID=A0ABS8QF49_9BACI|nr:RluA family pseudouridine synthase [Neobacillus sedimentimangrovi]MCD4837732.1 RluA family pseudouridine synthase [Neobacillus sedimentimangrovi]